MNKVTVDIVSHLLVFIIESDCFTIEQTLTEPLDILFHAIDSNAIGQI